MTVRELIDHLKDLPDDAIVLVPATSAPNPEPWPLQDVVRVSYIAKRDQTPRVEILGRH